jgi:cell division protein FtsB
MNVRISSKENQSLAQENAALRNENAILKEQLALLYFYLLQYP